MKQNHTAHRVAVSLLLAGAAIPAAAQETQPVTPPTITPAPAELPAPTPAPAASPSITFAPQAPVVQAVPPPPAPPPEAAAAEAPPARTTAARQRTLTTSRATRMTTAPVATAPVAPVTAAPIPAAAAPAPLPVAAAPAAPEAAPPASAAPAAAPQSEQISSGTAWAMLAIPLIAILALAALLLARRRRSRAEAYDDNDYAPVETAVEESLAVAPVAVAETDAAGRPWIDIGLRPVRAEDSLEVQVTVSNSGDAPAHDVRVSTWMLNGTDSSDSERALIDARSEAPIATVDVAPGDDKSVDTTVALPSATGTPILVAEARYPLPLGGEGRIAATFEIDMTEGDAEARLHDLIERA